MYPYPLYKEVAIWVILEIFLERSVGKQCVANSYIAVIYMTVLPIERWTVSDLDLILRKGDKLYNNINSLHNYLLVKEIPTVVHEFKGQYMIERCQEMFGLLHDGNGNQYSGQSFREAIKSLDKCDTWTSGILCLGNPGTASGSACALMVSKHNFYLFDPHSRDICGRPTEKGTSVLLHFRTYQQCCANILDLVCVLNCSQFEITILKVTSLSFSSNVMDQTSKHQIGPEISSKESSDTILEEYQKVKKVLSKKEKTVLKKEKQHQHMIEKRKDINYKEKERKRDAASKRQKRSDPKVKQHEAEHKRQKQVIQK